MTDRELEAELSRQLRQMTAAEQERVLRFAQELHGRTPLKPVDLDPPRLTHDEAQQMIEDIREAEQYAPVPEGLPGRDLLEFAGMLSPEEAEKMRLDIEAACEQVPPL